MTTRHAYARDVEERMLAGVCDDTLVACLQELASIGREAAGNPRSSRANERKNMYIAMNRFQIRKGREADFEQVWRVRDSRLGEVPGFRSFHLLRGERDEATGTTLYASHTVWDTREAFLAWTRSENFREAHRNAGDNAGMYDGHPRFEGFETVLER